MGEDTTPIVKLFSLDDDTIAIVNLSSLDDDTTAIVTISFVELRQLTDSEGLISLTG